MQITLKFIFFAFYFLLTHSLHLENPLPDICSYNLIKNRVKGPCEESLRPLGISSNISKNFYNCIGDSAPLSIYAVYFNSTPSLNASFGVYLFGKVSKHEDLKQVVVEIYINSVQQNTDPQPKADVLDVDSTFTFAYNAFLPYYLPTVLNFFLNKLK